MPQLTDEVLFDIFHFKPLNEYLGASANFVTGYMSYLRLLHQAPLDPWIDHNQQHQLTPELLHANKTLRREPRPLFYGPNRFDFAMATSMDVTSFIGSMGYDTADSTRHIKINFPKFLYLEPGDITLEDVSIGIFANIWRGRANLTTLKILWSGQIIVTS
jgi:hypothetical protein